MTNVLVIHPPINAERAQRLLGALRQAHADGMPLGSRAPHIRALCLSLERLLERLRFTATALMQELGERELCTENEKQELMIMIAQIDRLVTIVRTHRT